jgi:hypothetical protein
MSGKVAVDHSDQPDLTQLGFLCLSGTGPCRPRVSCRWRRSHRRENRRDVGQVSIYQGLDDLTGLLRLLHGGATHPAGLASGEARSQRAICLQALLLALAADELPPPLVPWDPLHAVQNQWRWVDQPTPALF